MTFANTGENVDHAIGAGFLLQRDFEETEQLAGFSAFIFTISTAFAKMGSNNRAHYLPFRAYLS